MKLQHAKRLGLAALWVTQLGLWGCQDAGSPTAGIDAETAEEQLVANHGHESRGRGWRHHDERDRRHRGWFRAKHRGSRHHRAWWKRWRRWPKSVVSEAGYNLHLSNAAKFESLQPGAEAERGRILFGVAADLVHEDPTGALFEGRSQFAQSEIVSNGRTCFTCHRGKDHSFGLPAPPLTETIDESDTLFSGILADAGDHPDAEHNLKQLGLIRYRPNRFNPQRSQSDPFRKVYFWRKSPALINVAFSRGFLLDGRARDMFETSRGAVFSHTQTGDARFDDLFSVPDGNDLEAFMFSLLSDERLAALRDPEDPLYDDLVRDPFLTVDIETRAQWRGAKVFKRNCMTCHNTPNVFNNLAHVMPQGNGTRPVTDPPFGPGMGRAFNIGVSERNKHDLRFEEHVGDGEFEPIVLPLANEDGSIEQHTVTKDIGLAAATARTVDVGRFKVPQLRNLADLAPYFHDNSVATIEGVVDFFLSDWYRSSPAGKRHPIKMNRRQRSDLIEFLYIL